MPSFLHSGDLGDIIYALPIIREMGGGTLLLDPTGGETNEYVRNYIRGARTKITRDGCLFLKPLIERQPYIDGCELFTGGQVVNHDLNRFRPLLHSRGVMDVARTITATVARAFGLNELACEQPWLTLPADLPDSMGLFGPRRVVINRTPRYQAKHHWWDQHAQDLSARGVFVGLEKEHEFFEFAFNVKLPYLPVQDALELAAVIRSAEKFVGNQSLAMAIAIGLGVPFFQEVYNECADCIFPRPNGNYF